MTTAVACGAPLETRPVELNAHVQPRSAQRRVQRHDAVFEQPHHEPSGEVSGEVVHDQQHPKWWQRVRQRWLDRQSSLPMLPCCTVLVRRQDLGGWHRVQDSQQLRFQPGVQHHVRATGDALDTHLAGRWMEQRQQLGGAMAHMFMRVPSRPTDRLPVNAWLRDRLVGAGFVQCPIPPTPSAPPRCRPARSAFFRAGVRVLDLDLATFALANGHAGLAPGPVALPGDAGVVQHRPDRVRADLWQTIRCAPQSTL